MEHKFEWSIRMYVDQYLKYLKEDRKLTGNSLDAYQRDLVGFGKYCQSKGVDNILKVDNTNVVSFLMYLTETGKSPSTLNRKLASIRAFYKYAIEQGWVSTNPAANVKAPKIERKEIEYLTVEEVELLLSMPGDKTPKAKRDKAILELMYATGIKVNELIAANVEDVNLRIGFFTCPGTIGKARIVPIGRMARMAIEDYLRDARDLMIKKNPDERALFVNFYGERISRQGLWKLLKGYGEKAGLEGKITPHILRNSFAVHMVQNGADLKSLQELLGHEDISATQIYLSVMKNRIKDVYDHTHPRA